MGILRGFSGDSVQFGILSEILFEIPFEILTSWVQFGILSRFFWHSLGIPHTILSQFGILQGFFGDSFRRFFWEILGRFFSAWNSSRILLEILSSLGFFWNSFGIFFKDSFPFEILPEILQLFIGDSLRILWKFFEDSFPFEILLKFCRELDEFATRREESLEESHQVSPESPPELLTPN